MDVILVYALARYHPFSEPPPLSKSKSTLKENLSFGYKTAQADARAVFVFIPF
jgi:hypothetical protein